MIRFGGHEKERKRRKKKRSKLIKGVLLFFTGKVIRRMTVSIGKSG